MTIVKKKFEIDNLKRINKIDNLIIGQFELIHKGHLNLFKNLKNFSFLTFDNNPNKNNFFYSIDQRIENLKKYNPKYIFVYDIKKNNISANEFIEFFLKKLKPSNIIVGEDFYFGKDKSGNVDLLKKYFNINVIKMDNNYSTRNILDLMKKSKIDQSLLLVDQPIYIEGIVVKNNQIGRTLGYPTANIFVNKNISLKFGSYIAIVEYNKKKYKALSFLGNSKTLKFEKIFLESYIYDFNENIYRKKIKVFLLKFIRENQKFTSKEELIKNINSDSNIAKNFFNNMN